MYQKAEQIGYENLPEHELLEMMLFFIIPRGNTNHIAHELIKKFDTAYGAITADPKELIKIDGIGTRAAEFLNKLPMIMKAIIRAKHSYIDSKITKHERLENLNELIQAQYIDTDMERVIALYLNSSYKLVKLSVLNDGSFDSVLFDRGKVVREAVLCGAANVVLSHNHPSGLVFPSEADRQITGEIAASLKEVDIKLLDHIIVGGSDYYSFRETNNL